MRILLSIIGGMAVLALLFGGKSKSSDALAGFTPKSSTAQPAPAPSPFATSTPTEFDTPTAPPPGEESKSAVATGWSASAGQSDPAAGTGWASPPPGIVRVVPTSGWSNSGGSAPATTAAPQATPAEQKQQAAAPAWGAPMLDPKPSR